MVQQRRGRRRAEGPKRSRRGLLARGVGILSIAALMILGLATTSGARSIYGFERYVSWGSWGGYTTSTTHHYTTTTKHTTTTYPTTSSSTKATTTTYPTTTTTTKPTTTTTTTMPTTTTTKPRDGEGCTPGYWRQAHHYDSWVGFSPGQDYETVFGIDASFTATLGQAVMARGGGESALARHAVAALLNASSSDVGYEFTTSEVIDIVQDAYQSGDFEDAKDVLADANEEGCPLN